MKKRNYRQVFYFVGLWGMLFTTVAWFIFLVVSFSDNINYRGNRNYNHDYRGNRDYQYEKKK